MKIIRCFHHIAVALALFCGTLVTTHAQVSGFAPAQDVQTYYRIFGTQGLPILIINGGPGMNSNGFADLARKLSDEHRVIIYDQRGTGKSTLNRIDTSTITMHHMAEDIETLRKHLGFERWTLLGHSFGGLLAAYYATHYPNSIDKLIFSSSGGINLDFLSYVGERINSRLTRQERDSLAYWNDRIGRGDTSFYARLQRGKALAPAYLFNKKYVPLIAERLTQGNPTINGLVFANLRAIAFDCTEPIRRFQRPTLIIHGKNDIIKVEAAEYAHKILPHSRLVVLEHCAHYGWLDKETEYFTAVRQFLREQ